MKLQIVFQFSFFLGKKKKDVLETAVKKAQEKGMKFHFIPEYSSIIPAEISFRLIFTLPVKP